MKRLSVIIVSAALIAPPALLSGHASAAPDDGFGDFDSFISGAMSDFDGFIDDANRDFIDFMRNPWKKYDAVKPVEKRVVPEPTVQPVADPEAKAPEKPTQLSIEEIIDLTNRQGGTKGGKEFGMAPVADFTPKEEPAAPREEAAPAKPQEQATPKAPTSQTRPTSPTGPTSPTPASPATPAAKPTTPATKPTTPATKPATPTTKPATPTKPATKPGAALPPQATVTSGLPVQFGGVTYRVSDALRGVTPAVALNENSVADAYEALFRADYKPLLNDLKQLRANGLNNDWALYTFIDDLSGKLATGNSRKVLAQFLLNQLGYRARVAIVPSENRLALYFAPNVQLYGVIFVDVNGVRYFDIDAKKPYSFYMCPKEAPAAKSLVDMNVAKTPLFKGSDHVSTRKGTGKSADMIVSTVVPEQLISYYKDIPQCDYSVYTNAAVDPGFKEMVLSALRPAIAGKSETEAAGLLLDYVQHAFEYATDGDQFGYEKPFFVEELYYYPKCDCEDRSVFYRFLVRELLGLDVVLLEYPNHIATAVRFNSTVGGDCVNIGGRNYTVCDPTYIGAGIGMAMPSFKNTAAKVVKI